MSHGVFKGIMSCLFFIAAALCFSSCRTSKILEAEVNAVAETTPVKGGADGVAVWVNKTVPAESTIIGARPPKGLVVFSLDGKVLQIINFPKGGAGEVDVRYNFPLKSGSSTDIAAGGVKYGKSLYIYRIKPGDGHLENILAEKVHTKINPYGSCLYHSRKTGKFYLFITSKSGRISQYELIPVNGDKIKAEFIRIIPFTLKGNPVIEACVCDDEQGYLYFSQENECKIWRCRAEPDSSPELILVDNAQIAPGDNVEGLALYKTGTQSGFLVASIQGSWKYKIYELSASYPLIAVFDIETAGGKGLVQSHDCIEVTSKSLGPKYKRGLMVTQNANHKGGHQFQIVPWEEIAEKLRLSAWW